MAQRVFIFDTTLRDGEQSPGASMNTTEKIKVAKQLARLKVDVIEAGFPIASPGDFEAVSLISREVKGVRVAALARCSPPDIEAAWGAVKGAEAPRIHVFLSTSPIHLKHQLKMSPEEVLELITVGVSKAKGYVSDVEFSPMDASRTEPGFLAQAVQAAIAAGATTVNIPDTVGYALPSEFGGLIRSLKQNVPDIDKAIISVHCHNDLGLAVANTLAAIEAGARQAEVTINGIGERAGNAALEEVVMCLATRPDGLDFETQVATTQLFPTSKLVRMITGVPVQPNKAIVGANAFAHESGIHQDGVLKEKGTYEIMEPTMIGLSSSELVLGKHSGRHALKDRLRAIGYERLSQEELDRLFARFKELADKKKEVYNEDLEALVAEELFLLPETYKLEFLNVMSGTQVNPVATVGLNIGGESKKKAGFGVGPVDAIYQTIMSLAGSKAEMTRFSIAAHTGGLDAQGEVTIRLKEGERVALGRSSDLDILLASAKALVNGLNRLEQLKNNPVKERPSL